ncbi:P-II family nitrogen regulator [Desulfovibrio sulfodismutans]|uniref:P-II family nitrogen regulator n=1 Tax=Desulfolutivibrio sulfodismutans TaxID=63561 RepID=A0A7K3NGC7_9BACT|nr:P-II family nitrogen regulator [Desulfolutivibrio sulfodismutans]NDY55242.1 P-II family nitrogen regulator [Desulfolutivibrio sulfodismutans]QLA12975.1 nitrogen fixation protein NifHD [Desulfolutivibrio sulfodismutans DSM 3696]
MKEIIAIIRPKKVGATKEALDALGFPSFMAMAVLGRGHQRGIAAEIGCEIPEHLLAQGRSGGMKYIPKRMLTLVVPDANADEVVRTIIAVNQTAQIGDGKIFISPVDDALRVRTDETGESAIL